MTLHVAILGSGNIGTDLMYKVIRNPALELAGVAGADPASEGLARARALGIATTDGGAGPFLAGHPEVEVAFDATSAHAHVEHAPLLAARGIRCIDLTPAALGPAVVPDVNLDEHLDAPDANLVTCGAQATVPIVAALSALGPVRYAEIVSTVASRSAGPGTRSNIDEFTVATARSLETLGGAGEGKAIIILNPAEPPIVMRNAIYAEIDGMTAGTATAAVRDAVERVAAYVPGYRLATEPLVSDGLLTAFIEVEGAGDYLPRFAGNLDIMTSAAVRVAERYAERRTA
jgi:acetaldehyde dehydrogenase (acetylating)